MTHHIYWINIKNIVFGRLKTTKSDKIAGTTDKITFKIYHDKKKKGPSFIEKLKNFIGLTR